MPEEFSPTKAGIKKFKERMEGFSVVFDSDEDAIGFMQRLFSDFQRDLQRPRKKNMSKRKPTIPSFESNRCDDGTPHERLVWRYLDSGFDVVAFVERDKKLTKSTSAGKFVGEMTWSSRGRVSLEEAEQFAVTILDGVKRARTMITNRNKEEDIYKCFLGP